MSAPYKKIFGPLFLLFLILPVFGTRFSLFAAPNLPTSINSSHLQSTHQNTSSGYAPGEVIVKFKKDKLNINSNNFVTVIKKFAFPIIKGLSAKSEDHLGNTVIYKINSHSSVTSVVSMLKQDADIDSVEPNYYRYLDSLGTNDTYASNLWGLDNTGQTLTLENGSTASGTADADMDMPEAWALSTGTTDVIVAVIDTGVAYNHPDLINNMWDGSNCVDENGSALGGCIHGYDFEDNDKDPQPTENSHGTHVAGTIAATQNNSKGVAGVGPRIKIMALKCGNPLSTSCIISSINFAIHNGAKVINASFGAIGGYSSSEYDAINNFKAAGGIFVAAAGNETNNNDTQHHYPSDYNLSNIISVAAIDQGDSLASFSNYGTTSVDVAAPGVNIYSTWAENTIINETFNNATSPALPPFWTANGNSGWATLNIGGTGPIDNWLIGDTDIPYAPSVDSTLTRDTVNLFSVSNAKFDFSSFCDTENTDPYTTLPDSSPGSDYMALEVSPDGTNYTELLRWNTYTIYQNSGSTDYSYEFSQIIPQTYLTANFKFRLRWVTDNDSNNGSSGLGCLVKDLKILTYTDGSDEKYQFLNGTSMAAPHVTGLAGYLWSIDPSLTYDQVVNNILTNGDSLASLSGKIATGRRVNAYNSVVALGITSPPITGPSITGLTDDSTPARSKTWTWSSDTPSTDTYRFLIDQSASSAPTGSYGTGTTATISDGTGTFYIHVQAQDASNNAGPVSTVSCILDNTGPTGTIENSSSTGFTLNYGETLYSFNGSTFVEGQDMSGFFTISPTAIGSSIIFTGGKIALIIPSPITGTKVSLNIGSTNTNLFDNLGNASASNISLFNSSNWQSSSTALSIGTSSIPDLFVSGVFVTTPGTNSGQSSLVNNTYNLLIGVSNTSGDNTVNIPQNTNTSELSNADFDASQIQLNNIDPSSVSNLGSDNVAQAAIQWGIVGTTLKFDNPLTINLYVGATFDGHTLDVFRSTALDSSWTTIGLGTSTCTVSSGICQFTATEASYYVAAYSIINDITPTPTETPTPVATNTPTPTTSSSNNSSPPIFTQQHDAPQCSATSPLSTPDLFKIITTKGSAKIIFTPINETITGYAVIYGFKKGDERFAATFNSINNNEGEQSFTINKLNPNTTYYFKVTALNDCTSGPWSEWIPAKASGKKTINKYKTTLVNKKVVLVDLFNK